MPVNIAIRCISHLLTSLDDGPLYFSSSIFCKLELHKRLLEKFLRSLARCIRRLCYSFFCIRQSAFDICHPFLLISCHERSYHNSCKQYALCTKCQTLSAFSIVFLSKELIRFFISFRPEISRTDYCRSIMRLCLDDQFNIMAIFNQESDRCDEKLSSRTGFFYFDICADIQFNGGFMDNSKLHVPRAGFAVCLDCAAF